MPNFQSNQPSKVMTSNRLFKMAAIESQIYFQVHCSDGTRLKVRYYYFRFLKAVILEFYFFFDFDLFIIIISKCQIFLTKSTMGFPAADLGMFSMFGRTGALTKRGPTKGAAIFLHAGEMVEKRVISKKGRHFFQEK